MREVPKKNYIIMLIIIIAIVLVTIFLSNIYNNRFQKTSVLYNYLSEIKKKDLDSYLLEKPEIIIYASNKYNNSNEEQEKKLMQQIIDNNIYEYIVYLNLEDKKLNILNSLNKKYDGKLKNKLPVLIVFENGKIKEAYYDLEKIDFEKITENLK